MKYAFAVAILFFSLNVSAQSGGKESWSFGLFGGSVTSSQDDMNTMITRANTRVGGISTSQLGNAYEAGAYLQRRFTSSIFALQFRPSYFFQTASGTGTGGTFAYSLNGFTVMPLLRAYILENKYVRLYIQGGVGWGYLNGKIEEAGTTANFSGSNTGYQGGIGVLFCLTSSGRHCFFTEGNARYMSIERNTVSDTSGSFAAGSLSQAVKGSELEIDGHDFGTSLSGVQAILGYQFNF